MTDSFGCAACGSAWVVPPRELIDEALVRCGTCHEVLWSPTVREDLATQGLALLAPPRGRAARAQGWPRWLVQTRRRIETVLSQLTDRYHAKRVWARDAWHLTARWLRNLVSHTMAVLLCQRASLSPLAFANLITA